jgi:hypothetical protein
MASYSRWDDVKKKRPGPDAEARAGIEQDLALGQLIYEHSHRGWAQPA